MINRNYLFLSLFIFLISSECFSETFFKFEKQWPTSSMRFSFSSVNHGAVNSKGHIYISDASTKTIYHFSKSGYLINSFVLPSDEGLRGETSGIFIDDDDNLYAWNMNYIYIYYNDKFVREVYIRSSSESSIKSVYADRDIIYAGVMEGNTNVSYLHKISKNNLDSLGRIQIFPAIYNDIHILNNELVYIGIYFDESGTSFNNGVYKNSLKGEMNSQLLIDQNSIADITDSFWLKSFFNLSIDSSASKIIILSTWYDVYEFNVKGVFIKKYNLPKDPYAHERFSHNNMGDLFYSKDYRNFIVLDNKLNMIRFFDVEDGLQISDWGGERTLDYPKDILVRGGVIALSNYNKRKLDFYDYNFNFLSSLDDIRVNAIDRDLAGNYYIVSGTFVSVYDYLRNYMSGWEVKYSKVDYVGEPQGIAVDPTARKIYLSHSINESAITTYSMDGIELSDFPLGASGVAQSDLLTPPWGGNHFYSPNKLYIKDNYVYASTFMGLIRFHKDYGFDSGFVKASMIYPDFYDVVDVGIDDEGFIYAVSSLNSEIRRFTSEGVLVEKIGGAGFLPYQLQYPQAISINNNRIYVADTGNNRIVVYKKVARPDNSKAIIIAGGKGTSDHLWDEVQANAHHAFHALASQGYTKENIYYLNANATVDLDRNGKSDDVDAAPTLDNVRKAITEWASDADNVVIYMIDHGGYQTYQLNANEIMAASQLSQWLDTLQSQMSGKLTLIYDACSSGTFLSVLANSGYDRTVITSTTGEQNASFNVPSHFPISFGVRYSMVNL